MSETGRESFEAKEPSARDSAIAVSDIATRLPRLQLKLAEYVTRAQGADTTYMHPGHIAAYPGGLHGIFKRSILESVLELTGEKTPTDEVYLHEVAVRVGDKTGINVTRAATIPFRYNSDGMIYEPDVRRLREETGFAEIEFSNAYAVIRAYCSGELWGVEGGTGLPEVK